MCNKCYPLEQALQRAKKHISTDGQSDSKNQILKIIRHALSPKIANEVSKVRQLKTKMAEIEEEVAKIKEKFGHDLYWTYIYKLSLTNSFENKKVANRIEALLANLDAGLYKLFNLMEK